MTPEKKVELAARYKASKKPQTKDARLRSKIKYMEWREAQIMKGGCVCCALPSVANFRCEKHWFAMIGSNYKLNPKNGGVAMLQAIWKEQNGICPLSGDRLVKGVNASLDHIVPMSKGGDHSRSNLRWVIKAANFIKGDMSDADFIGICQRVARHQESMRIVSAKEAN